MALWFRFLHIITSKELLTITDFVLYAKHGHIFLNLIHLCFFRQSLFVPLAVLNLPCIPSWLWTHTDLLASDFRELGLRACVSMPSLWLIFLAIKQGQFLFLLCRTRTCNKNTKPKMAGPHSYKVTTSILVKKFQVTVYYIVLNSFLLSFNAIKIRIWYKQRTQIQSVC